MPILGESRIERLVLPSTKGGKDEAWVDIRINPDAGDIMAYLSEDKKGEYGSSIFRLLASNILKWNFVDKDGKEVDISVESVRRMTMFDMNFLLEKVQLDKAFEGLGTEKKSDS